RAGETVRPAVSRRSGQAQHSRPQRRQAVQPGSPGEISQTPTDGGRIIMKITRITPFATALPLRRPMKTGGSEMTTVENIFVRIDTDEGLTGWGEASSAPRMTGETVASIMEAIRFLTPALEGRDPRNSA